MTYWFICYNYLSNSKGLSVGNVALCIRLDYLPLGKAIDDIKKKCLSDCVAITFFQKISQKCFEEWSDNSDHR